MQVVIHFLQGNSIDIQTHYLTKDYRDDVVIEIDNLFYEVYFFTRSLLTYEMTGDGFFALPGMIILEEISHENILASINYLVKIKYFEFLKGEHELDLHKRALSNWYLNEPFIFDKELLYSLKIFIN